MASVKNLTINGIDILDFCHPIGSIYMSSNSKDPSDIFGGTWERIEGKVLVGVDENDANFSTPDKTGGSKSTALNSEHLPVRTIVSTQNFTGSSKYLSGWHQVVYDNSTFHGGFNIISENTYQLICPNNTAYISLWGR